MFGFAADCVEKKSDDDVMRRYMEDCDRNVSISSLLLSSFAGFICPIKFAPFKLFSVLWSCTNTSSAGGLYTSNGEVMKYGQHTLVAMKIVCSICCCVSLVIINGLHKTQDITLRRRRIIVCTTFPFTLLTYYLSDHTLSTIRAVTHSYATVSFETEAPVEKPLRLSWNASLSCLATPPRVI